MSDQQGQSSSGSLLDEKNELDMSIQTEFTAAVDCAGHASITFTCCHCKWLRNLGLLRQETSAIYLFMMGLSFWGVV